MGSQRVATTERLDTYTQGYLEVVQLPCQVEIPCQDFNMECLISTLFANFLNYFIGLN